MQITSTATPLLRWDAGRQQWWWADPASGQLLGWQGGVEQQAAAIAFAAAGGRGRLPRGVAGVRLQERVATLAVCASGRLLLGMGKRLALLDLAGVAIDATGRLAPGGQHLQVLTTIDAAEPRTAISAGCVDRAGHFVFGTVNTAVDRRPIGSFYQYSTRHGVRRLALPAVAEAAGLAVSADGGTLYFCDAAHGALMACRYDAAAARASAVRPCPEAAATLEAADTLFADGVQSS
jgi:L-arabinonolactonase